MKVCNFCGENKSLEDFYTQNKTKADGTPYLYYHPECKRCTAKKATKWGEDNKEKKREHWRKHSALPHKRELQNRLVKEAHANGSYREWQRNNPDKLKEYRLSRAHKQHEITQKEWDACKKYFNESCAYCGITDTEAKLKYNNYLHKDHADHEGANDLSNCIPACKSCNGSKHTFDLVEWYAKSENYSKRRLNKIVKWLEKDYKIYLRQNKKKNG